MLSARTCGAPGVVPNGWHQGDCSDFGCRVSYKCSEGYELIGKSERLCHSDGYWVPKDLPACVRKYFNTEFVIIWSFSTDPYDGFPRYLNGIFFIQTLFKKKTRNNIINNSVDVIFILYCFCLV